MKRVGLITLWKYNYGSQLQCFATKRLLRALGYECVLLTHAEARRAFRLLDHIANRLYRYAIYLRHPSQIANIRTMTRAAKRHAAGLPESVLGAMDAFAQKELMPRSVTYRQRRLLGKDRAFVAFLSGSDQVFSGARIDRDIPGLLSYVPAKKRIAFAPSFGSSGVAKYNEKRFAKALLAFAHLSAREPEAAAHIRDLTGRDCIALIDPTLQISCAEWRKLLNARRIKAQACGGCYLLAYFLDAPSREALAAISDLARTEQLEIIVAPAVYPSYQEANLECKLFTGDALSFARLVERAACVCTDSFHGTALALTFHVPFYVFPRQYAHGVDQSGRIVSLLGLCGLSDRLVAGEWGKDAYANAPQFGEADAFLARQRRVAGEYLKSALHAAEKG